MAGTGGINAIPPTPHDRKTADPGTDRSLIPSGDLGVRGRELPLEERARILDELFFEEDRRMLGGEAASLAPGHQDVLTTIGLTVLLSVLAHGLSAAPLAERYGRWFVKQNPKIEVSKS